MLGLDTLRTYEPRTPLSSLLGTQPSTNDPRPANPAIAASIEDVRWTDNRTVRFAGNVFETIWTQDPGSGSWSGRFSIVGRVLIEMSVPGLRTKQIRRWRSAESGNPGIGNGRVGSVDETSSRVSPEVSKATGGETIILAPTTVDGEQKEIYWVEDAVMRPSVIERFKADYTPEALADRRQGSIILNLIVGEDGMPRNFRIEQDIGLGLAEKAIEAVMKWRFLPGIANGRPVPVEASIEIPFRLSDADQLAVKP